MNERERLIANLKKAMPVLKKIEDLERQSAAYDRREEKQAEWKSGWKNLAANLLSMAVSVVLTVLICKGIGDVTGKPTGIGWAITAFLILAVACYFLRLSFLQRRREKTQRDKKAAEDRLRAVWEKFGSLAAWIPEDYRYFNAASYMLTQLQNGRAETWRQAVELYEAELRYNRQDQMAQEQHKQERNLFIMNAVLQAINTQRIVSAAGKTQTQNSDEILGSAINTWLQ